MAQFPFVYNYQTGRIYYGPALEEKAPTPQLWLRGPQTPFYEKDNPPSKVGWAAAGFGAAFAAGFLPTPKGGRVWDWYVKGIRAVEEYSPAQIFRTFQLSTFFSQFETATKTLKLTPELLRGNRPYAEYLAQLIGGKDDVYGRLIREGVELKEGRLIWSKKGDTALRWAAGLRVPQGSHAYYPSAYARSVGATGIFEKAGLRAHRFLADRFPIFYRPQVINPVIEGMPTTIIGGRHLPQHLWRQAAGWGTEWISRFNRLLEAPFEMQPFRTVFGKVQAGLKKVTGRELAFAVKEGPGLRMLGKLSLKYGLAATAIGLGYQTVDWMTRRSELLDHTAFSEGITAGVSTLGIRASLTAAELAERTGLQRYREFQEEVAPGSTSIQKLLAFPIMGGSAALLGSYGIKAYRMAKTQLTRGIPAHEARRLVVEGMKEFGGEGLFARMGRALTTPKGLYARQDIFGRAFRRVATKEGDKLSFAFLGKLGPTKLAGLLGIAGGAALTLPFWPGALIPETSSEELKRIYSGKQEIPIRRGRWWEFGRSAFEGQRIMYYRPHWYPRMMMRAREKSIWGPEEDELSPLEKLWRREFSYELEKTHYRERPYPITSLPFEDVPFIGPLLSNTLGRLIKPLRVMHTEEWVGKEGVIAEAPGFGERIATEIGETPGGVPESPYGIKGAVGEQIYRLQEMFGLAGFAQVSLKERLTGSGDWFDQITQLESARRIAGFERFYWDLELGGLLGTCLIPGSIITTSRGMIPIEQVKPGDSILSKGAWRKVSHILAKNHEKSNKLLTLSIPSAGVELTCTENHWIPIVRRHKYSNGHPKPWKKCNYDILELQVVDLEPGDFLFYSVDQVEKPYVIDLDGTGKCSTNKYVYQRASLEYAKAYEILEENLKQLFPHSISRAQLRNMGFIDSVAKDVWHSFWSGKQPARIDRYILVDQDFAYVIGWYIAEGSSDETKLCYTMHANEISYAERILSIFEKQGFNGRILIKNNTLRLKIYSSQLARYFKIFGQHAADKYIPIEFKQLPNNILAFLVEGLMLGDGWKSGNKGGFTSVSRQLVKDMYDVLLKLGRTSNLYLDYIEKGKGCLPQGTPRLDTHRHYLRLTDGRYQYRFLEDSFLVPLKAIVENKQDIPVVYDLTIEDIHFYTAEGVLVHNTEAFRRLYPHRRRQIPLYNPIRNLMPEWLPGPGEKSPDFLHGDPYCITSGTFVEVLEGCFKRVCDLTIDDRVRTHTGKWVQPKKIMKRDMRLGEKLFEIKVSSLSAFPVRASEEHPFWTADGWVQAKDLEVGNYVGYPLPKLDDLLVDDGDQLLDLTQYCDLPANTSHIFIQGSQEYADCVEFIEKNPGPYHRGERKKILNNHGWSAKTFENAQRGLKNGSLNRIPRRINPWCAEWGLLTGYYAAEGSSYNGSVSFALHEDEKMYQEQILNALQYLFNLNGTIYPNSTGRGVQLVVTNKALAQILPNILGYNSYNKRLPLWAGSFIPALSALFNGDGSFFFDQDKPRLSLKSKSQKLLWSVRQFLLLWGFVGSIVEDNLIYRGQAAKDCARFISTLKYQNCPNSSRLCRHTYIKNNYVWMRVFSKEEIPQEPVYGIEVDIDDSFCVVGIATHNTKVPEGELRLPGRGYEARFPELASVKPEDYPLIHKYKVLADVAPYSDKFKLYRNMVRAARKGDTWSEEEEAIYQTTEEQVSAKKKRIEFQEYQYLSPMGKIFDEAKHWGGEESSELIAALNRASTEEEKESVFKRLFGGYWELLAHNAETAFDQLTPVSPGAKLVHVRTPIEAYERLQAYGTESSFWQHPVKHFIRPFSSLLGKSFGYKDLPTEVTERRNLEEYFDTLEYVKYTRLANLARKSGDTEAVKEFEAKKDETLFGINPFTRNYRSVFRALPRRERDYFNAFVEADTTEERARILELVPDNEKALYVARWKLAFSDEIKKARKQGILTEAQLAEADEIVDTIYDEARAEGFPHTKELFAEYIETRTPGETYGDWYRRTRLLPNVSMPGPDWVGWHPSVDLEDIKLRVVQTIGEDMHDYDLWPSRAQTLVNKPYLTDEAIEAIMQPEELTEVEMRDRINELLLAKGIRPHVTMNTTYGNVSSSLNVDIEQEYDEDIVQVLRENRG